ncbi:hypothetical protein HMPREF1584_01417 [Gardnerella vaginalis JCP8481A]|nr:hypothetical protein HMPREF1584_01417 [Gardnerella vaginalis JCP8481A]
MFSHLINCLLHYVLQHTNRTTLSYSYVKSRVSSNFSRFLHICTCLSEFVRLKPTINAVIFSGKCFCSFAVVLCERCLCSFAVMLLRTLRRKLCSHASANADSVALQ